MGKIKQFVDNFKGYVVTADVYFPNESNPDFATTFIEPEFFTADTVKSVINQVRNRKFRITPNKAELHIFRSYSNGLGEDRYSQLVKSISLTSKQCKNAWV